jgi:hypothetical protein
VDELHFAENKGDKIARILLTSSAGGVKTQSFFDSFQGFPVSGESGTEVSSLRRACSATATEGRQRSIANHWLRGQETVKGKTGSRGVEPKSGWQ